jgi:hypothetical protein
MLTDSQLGGEEGNKREKRYKRYEELSKVNCFTAKREEKY